MSADGCEILEMADAGEAYDMPHRKRPRPEPSQVTGDHLSVIAAAAFNAERIAEGLEETYREEILPLLTRLTLAEEGRVRNEGLAAQKLSQIALDVARAHMNWQKIIWMGLGGSTVAGFIFGGTFFVLRWLIGTPLAGTPGALAKLLGIHP